MTQKNIRAVGMGLLVALWLVLVGFSWFGEHDAYSDAERRKLAQAPELKKETIMDRTYMGDFETFTLDQFPLRDRFLQAKNLFLFYGLQQTDNNGRYVWNGYLGNMETEIDEEAIDKAAKKFNMVYDVALKGRTDNIYFSIIPDKNYVISKESGHLSMDMGAMEQQLQEQIPWATYIDIKDTLTKENYYFTDTHWRQETLVPTASVLCQGMGVEGPKLDSFTVKDLDRPFYGVFYRQVGVPVAPDTMRILQNDMLNDCIVTNYSDPMRPVQIGFHNLDGLAELKEPYDVYLYGFDTGTVVIENPNAKTDRELFLFRDSFGCSMAPLLVENYARVTVIDLRPFLPPMLLMMNGRAWDLSNADVLFMFSSQELNNVDSFR